MAIASLIAATFLLNSPSPDPALCIVAIVLALSAIWLVLSSMVKMVLGPFTPGMKAALLSVQGVFLLIGGTALFCLLGKIGKDNG